MPPLHTAVTANESPRSAPRRGMTLIEVLFAIGVIAIGLLGVLALLPVAGHQAQQGAIADRAAAAGKNAVAEFDIRSMRNPNNWVAAVANPTDKTPATPAFVSGQAFAIDPLFGAEHGDSRFPYTSGANPTMRRISLRSGPGRGPMDALLAEQVFMSQDDLVFDPPADRDSPPRQIFGAGELKRQYEGNFSWMATVAPKLDRLAGGTDLYRLSIVVFFSRDLTTEPLAGEPASERAARVQTFWAGGFAGGDVVLQADADVDLELRENDWVMLAGDLPPAAPGDPAIPVFQWYRVLAADSEPTAANGTWIREATLHGPDWDTDAMPNPQVTLMTGVVAVYERIIRLETSSLWTNF